RLPELHARLRGHVKNHKSPHIARLQLEHGAFGICAATVWEAIVMVRAGATDVLIANQLVNPQKRRAAALLAREATVLVNVDGVGCPILSADGTATAFWTGADPRITELQLGSYAAMDDYHYLMEPRFKKATSAVVTVISRRKDRLVLNLGKKTFGAADVGNIP